MNDVAQCERYYKLEGHRVVCKKRINRPLSLPSRLWLVISPFLPLLFIVGWFICRDFFDNDARFAWMSLLATIAASVFAFVTHRPIEGLFPLIILFTIFLIGYYIKFYWFAIELKAGNLERLLEFLDLKTRHFLNPRDMLRAFELSTLGFFTFCCSGILTVLLRMGPYSINIAGIPKIKRILKKTRILNGLYIIAAFLLWGCTFFLIRWLGVGIHKHSNAQLPAGVAGLIVYGSSLVPAILTYVISRSNNKGLRLFGLSGLIGLIVYGISEILIRGSRGAFVGALIIPLGTLWLVYGQFTRKRAFSLIAVFLVVALMRPVFTAYRTTLASSSSMSLGETIQHTIRVSKRIDSAGVYGSLIDSMVTVGERFVGVETLLFFAPGRLVDADISLVLRGGLSQKFTQDVVGYGPTVTTHFNPPGLVGAFYFLWGKVGVVCGIFAFVFISQWIWGRLCHSHYWVTPVALTQIAALVFLIGNEGALEIAIRKIIVVIFFMLGLEFLSRVRL